MVKIVFWIKYLYVESYCKGMDANYKTLIENSWSSTLALYVELRIYCTI